MTTQKKQQKIGRRKDRQAKQRFIDRLLTGQTPDPLDFIEVIY